jgi:glycosyltransferase involved in cell wall biosynthesis
MRVALLTNFIPPYRVSLYRAIREETGALRVLVSTEMEASRDWTADWGDLDVAVQRSLRFQRTWKGSGFEEPYELHVPYDTVQQLVRFRPDVIVTGELGARSLQALVYAKRAGVPVVLWATLSDRIEQHRNRARKALRRALIPRFDKVIVNGADGARYIARYRADDPVHVPYTTDMAAFHALPVDRVARGLLFVGSLTERKGFHFLLEACRKRGFQLSVVGHGPLRTDLPNVRYSGSIPYATLPDWFARAGFLIMPSLADEWGVVVNEALAAGVPVIGSVYSQAVDELIEDGVNGWRFEPTDADAVADAIERALATSEDELIQMRTNARATSHRLEPADAASRIAQLLKSL